LSVSLPDGFLACLSADQGYSIQGLSDLGLYWVRMRGFGCLGGALHQASRLARTLYIK